MRNVSILIAGLFCILGVARPGQIGSPTHTATPAPVNNPPDPATPSRPEGNVSRDEAEKRFNAAMRDAFQKRFGEAKAGKPAHFADLKMLKGNPIVCEDSSGEIEIPTMKAVLTFFEAPATDRYKKSLGMHVNGIPKDKEYSDKDLKEDARIQIANESETNPVYARLDYDNPVRPASDEHGSLFFIRYNNKAKTDWTEFELRTIKPGITGKPESEEHILKMTYKLKGKAGEEFVKKTCWTNAHTGTE